VVTLNAQFDGTVIVPDEPLSLAVGARLIVTVVPIREPTHTSTQRLDLPLMKSIDPSLVRAITEDAEFDLENAKIHRLQT
jgi:hypothetical protein